MQNNNQDETNKKMCRGFMRNRVLLLNLILVQTAIYEHLADKF